MFSLELRGTHDGRDELIAELWDAGSAGIVELDEERLLAFFDDDASPKSLLARFAQFQPAMRQE